MTKMKPEIKKLWVDALRSGKYKQGREKMLTRNGTHCCLGVLCEVAIENGVDVKKVTPINDCSGSYNGSADWLPDVVRAWAGLGWLADPTINRIDDPRIRSNSGETYRTLSEANDAGINFDIIADIIEKHF